MQDHLTIFWYSHWIKAKITNWEHYFYNFKTLFGDTIIDQLKKRFCTTMLWKLYVWNNWQNKHWVPCCLSYEVMDNGKHPYNSIISTLWLVIRKHLWSIVILLYEFNTLNLVLETSSSILSFYNITWH